MAALTALVEGWKNEGEALRFYVGEQQRRATLYQCAEQLAYQVEAIRQQLGVQS